MALSEEERFVRFTRIKRALKPIHARIRRSGGKYKYVKVPVEMIENLDNEIHAVLGPWSDWVGGDSDEQHDMGVHNS